MIYKDFQGKKLSALGMGCMRLPTVGDVIDEGSTAEMMAYAMKHGINYYDTAWGYHNGQSEIVTGKLLAQYPRDSYYIATKFPGYDLSNMDKVEEIFQKQLEKTGMDYFDFYLFHNVSEKNIDAYLDDEKYGIFSYLLKQKEAGRILHLGFSAHGSLEVIKRFLAAYGPHMEFCQLQLNWLDWNFQNGAEKVRLLQEHGIPVWVMEPVRGGRLATLPEADTARLKALRPEETVPGWAFRFLQSQEGLAVTLSGMSNMNQLKENIRTYETEKPLNQEEQETLFDIARNLAGCVPCTSCRYCVDHCPQGLDIPLLLGLYNEQRFTGGGFLVPMTLSALSEDKHPLSCLQCRSCEAVCPQNIAIADCLADFAERIKPKADV